LKSLASSMGSTSARWLFTGIYYLLPNLANLSVITPVSHGRLPGLAHVVTVILYSVIYIAVILAAATLIFSRRNFK
ncbi:MAG: ABC transporter permease, partial [Pyrinomonadaceae bacterium]